MKPIVHKILIVDDTRLNMQILVDILKNDYQLLCAKSGKEALEIAASESIDLILLDIVMPEMDGYEVCKRLKSHPRTKKIPVVFISAMRDEEAEAKGLELGAIDYLFKPVSPAIVKIRVKNHLELKLYRDILEQQSLIDGLTGISNRRHFNDVFDKEWRRALRNGDTLSLVFLDIDFFKKYNDCYGHLAGDDCLRQVGNTLKDSLQRAGDLVARYGGEEFVIILPSLTLANAAKVGEKVRKNIESLKIAHEMSTVSKYVTISVGVSSAQVVMGVDPDSLIEKADNALYRAKSEGRNRVVAM